jgi:hypothetical protein
MELVEIVGLNALLSYSKRRGGQKKEEVFHPREDKSAMRICEFLICDF